MTLNDIGRMLKLAKVPQSKTIQTTYPNPSFVVLVPAASYFIIVNVVGQLKMRTDNVQVQMLEHARDVRAGEHVFVKVTGKTEPAGRPWDDAGMPEAFYRRVRMRTARARNRSVMIDCTSVVL